jgi:hypothetical protein
MRPLKQLLRTLTQAICLVALPLILVQSAQAVQIWNYTGPAYTTVGSPLVAGDFATGSVTLINDAPSDGTIQLNSGTVASYSADIGGSYVLDETNSVFDPSVVSFLTFASGQLTGWRFEPQSTATPAVGNPAEYEIRNIGSAGSDLVFFFINTSGQKQAKGIVASAGSWALVPEPSIFSLAAVGLLVLNARRQRAASGR